MNKSSHIRTAALAALTLGISAAVAPAAVVFTDNFDIADTGSLDGSDQTGRHTGLLAGDVVLRSGGVQQTITGGQLNILTPPFGRVRFQSAPALPGNALWDFASGPAGAQILADGGFRFEFDWTPANNTTTDWVSYQLGFNYFDTPVGVNQPSTDFGIIFRNNGEIGTFDNSAGTTSGAFDVSAVVQRHALIDFAFSSFADGSLVTASVFVDNVSVGAPLIFDWNGNSGVINMEMAANDNPKRVDNVSITTVPEPTSLALIGLAGLAFAGRRRRQA
jgi:PEP-CTERM motif